MERQLLFVDDEPFLCTLFRIGLKSQGITVLTAANAGEALDLLAKDQQGAIKAVLTDINMPSVTGWELLEMIKQKRPDLLRMVITAEPENQTQGQQMVASGELFAYFDKIDSEQAAIFKKCREAMDLP